MDEITIRDEDPSAGAHVYEMDVGESGDFSGMISLEGVIMGEGGARRLRDWLTGWLQEYGHEARPSSSSDRSFLGRELSRVVADGKTRFEPTVNLAESEREPVRAHTATLRAAAVEHVTKKRNPAHFQADGGVSLDDIERVHAWLAGMVAE